MKMRLAADHLEGVHPSLAWFVERLEEWAKAFSLAVEKLLVAHGKKVVSMGFLQERVANAAINLYGMVATPLAARHPGEGPGRRGLRLRDGSHQGLLRQRPGGPSGESSRSWSATATSAPSASRFRTIEREGFKVLE